jgi:hypothetical protein
MATTYKTQDGDEIRSMTKDEIAAYQIACEEVEARAKEEENRKALKAATLAKLGINADEAIALLS